MCYYLIATLPSDANINSLKPIIERHQMGFDVLENKNLSNQLPKGERLFLATKNYCDCDTVIGCDTNKPETDNFEGEIQKLRQKGWGEAKIQRWKNEKSISVEIDIREQDRELNNWYDFIYEALKGNKTSYVGIIKHYYRDTVELENFEVTDIREVRIIGIKPKYLRKVEDDVYYKFRP